VAARPRAATTTPSRFVIFETNGNYMVFSIASFLWWFIFVVIWVAIAFWPARVAARKGHSFIGFFIFSLVFFPAALIAAYLVGDRRG
jgi:hypothetical protein